MKVFKKIVFTVLVFIAVCLLGGYFYFENKFTPPENYLTVSGTTQNIPMKWDSTSNDSCAAIFLPVRIKGIDKTFYMQLDLGSAITLFYKKSMESIQTKFKNQIKFNEKDISISFNIGGMNISSGIFELLDYGKKVDFDNPDALNIIGTIGTDLLEKRVTVLDFRNNSCSFINDIPESGFAQFEFKKRKIIFPASIGNKDLKLLYDSGSSNYELITNKEEWEKYKTPNSQVKTEKGNSWGNTLKVISASADHKMKIGNQALQLSEVTYVQGTSAIQHFLMKRSGMQGMIGNKLFINHTLTLDCERRKFKLD